MTPADFKRIRLKAGHTTASLAAFLRVTQRYVQKIEDGSREPMGPVAVLMELLDEGRI